MTTPDPAGPVFPSAALARVLDQMGGILAELDAVFQHDVAAMPPFLDSRECAERFLAAAERFASVSAVLLREEIQAACRHATSGHQRCGRKPCGGNDWDEAEQETAFRLLLRVRDLSREPIDDFRGYAFVVMDSLLKAWRRRSREDKPLTVKVEPAAPRSDPAEIVADSEGDLLAYLARVPSPVSEVSFADVYREMLRAERNRKVAALRLGLSESQVLKLWRGVQSLVRQRFSVSRN